VRPVFQLDRPRAQRADDHHPRPGGADLNVKDKYLMDQIKSFFSNKGTIDQDTINNLICYRVQKIEDLINVIIPHLTKYPLLTQKHADFLLFKLAIELMSNKEHLTIEGLNKISEGGD